LTATLADFWPTLCPALPPVWDTPVNRRNLADLTRRLAPVPRVALECRLEDRAPTIELQQCIRRDDGEPALLRDFLVATQPAAMEGEGPWARLHRFCTAWADPTTLVHRGITEVFLEHDLDPAPQPAFTPSVFFSVDESDGEAVAEAALALLLPALWPPGLGANLAACFAACPAGSSVSYLGAMLGRTTEALRVNVKRLRLEELVPFLQAVGWNGPPEAIEQWAGWAWDRVDGVTVCLDVGPVVYPHLGLECALAIQPTGEPRWRELLEELSADRLCTAANAAALLGLPGVLHPPEAHGEWPAPWIVASLAGPADHFSTTERQLSHVKLTVAGQQVLAKGYWAAGHVWRAPRPRGDGAHPPSWDRSVAPALSRAIDFLLSRQAHTGRWSDFLLPAGPSDEWVTAFVGACLLGAPAEKARRGAGQAWAALLRRRADEPGWGYNRLTPADADSTAWALRLAAGLGVAEDGRIAAARRFLEGHAAAGGGITTYAERDPIRRSTRLPEDASFAGWQAPHACVTAAAAPLLGAAAIDYLGRQQGDAGSWQGYWWWDDEYTTALAVEVLPAARATSEWWAQTRLGESGAVHGLDGAPSAWATAWCLRVLGGGTTSGAYEAQARAVGWLLYAQHQDGSWPASARLRVPMPGELDAAGQERTMTALDQNRVFTTAAVAAALATTLPV
jgi:hypothetical protein